MKDNANIFKALADRNRLRVLKMLRHRTLCVCEITAVLKLAPSTVSQHLSILKREGFILESRDGKWMNYLLNTRPADPRVSAILGALDFWIGDLPVSEKDAEKARLVDRTTLCAG